MLRSRSVGFPDSLKTSYGQELAVTDRDETRGELCVGIDQRHERRRLLWMGRRIVDPQQSTTRQHAPEVRPPSRIFWALGIKKDEIEGAIG